MFRKPPSFAYLNRIMEGKLPENVEAEFTDRYQALGIPYPNPKTICKGHCEGTGFVPIKKDEDFEKYDPRFQERWEEDEAKEPSEDGWHFVVCPDCEGTGLDPKSQYGVITGEDQKCPEESNDYVVDLKQKPVSSRQVTRARDVKAVGVGFDKIPGSEIWDEDEDEENPEEVIDTLLNSLQGVNNG